MTTYFEALQRQTDKRWDYTRRTGSTPAHPIGYCAGWNYPRLIENLEPSNPLIVALEHEQAARLQFKDKYHKDGHATAEEAMACHDTFLLDTALEFRRSETEQHRCVVCKAWAQNLVDVRGENIGPHHWVCDEHATRAAYEPAFRARYDRGK